MKKKSITIICLILIALVLLVPIPVHYKDGGTVAYNAVLYSVTKEHSLITRPADDGGYEVGYKVGTRVRVLLFEVYNNVQEVFAEQENG